MGTSLPGAHPASSWAQVQHHVQLVLQVPTDAMCLEHSARALEPEHPPSSSANVCAQHWDQCFPCSLISLLQQPFARSSGGGVLLFFPSCRWETEALIIKVTCSFEVNLRIEEGCDLRPGK